MVSLRNVFLIPSQMKQRSPTQRQRKADRRTRRKTERRREKGQGVVPPPPPQRITSSSSLTALTPLGHWGSPCTGMCLVGSEVTAPVAVQFKFVLS